MRIMATMMSPKCTMRKAHMDVRAERYIRRIESADKGRTEKKIPHSMVSRGEQND